MNVSTKQHRIAELARQMPTASIKSLNHHFDLEWLREAFRLTANKRSTGVDGVTKVEYEERFDENLESLLNRFKSGTYRAPAVKRVFIPKDGAKGNEKRPIGIPTIEDKILQRAVTMALEPIFEADFLDCSYGFRPNRNVHQAVEKMWRTVSEFAGCWVLEVDIRKYFETIEHKHLREIFKQRVCDGVIDRTLGKWLKAGVQHDGSTSFPDSGTQQGGVISPLLSNLYLHEVLDKWFTKEIKQRLQGRSELIRYADDFVILFENQRDAERVFEVLPKRFERFGLTIHPDKTRLIHFSPPIKGKRKGETFTFLGFTHYWGKTRKGRWIPKHKTAKVKFSKALRKVYEWCRDNRHSPIDYQWRSLKRKLHGHYTFYGISFNSRNLNNFFYQVKRAWQKWLNRRNRENFMRWNRFNKLLERYPLPKPRIVHSYFT